MKAHYKTADGRIVFEVNGETPKAVFEQIAGVQELFEAETECGLCHHEERRMRFQVRDVDDNKYYEIICLHCFARFQFGQNKKGGGLFPKRKDKDGNRLPARGWAKYEPRKPDQQAARPANGTAPASAPSNSRPAIPPGEYQDNYAPGITEDDVPF